MENWNRKNTKGGKSPNKKSNSSRKTFPFTIKDVRMEFSKNREALVEGCTGILEYKENVVRLNTEDYIVQFSGRNLSLKCMTHDSIIVTGYFLKIEFLS